MFVKFKKWACSKLCASKYDAAAIRQDLSDIINDIKDDVVVWDRQSKFDAEINRIYPDFHWIKEQK